MQDETIDVVIPVYNGEKTIVSAVSSILSQTYKNIRVHIIDDGSTDRTSELLQSLANSDSRIVVHRQENAGIVDALNAGLAKCTATFLARHDADDLAYPERFQVQSDYLLANPDCVAVGSAVRHIDANGRPTGSYGRVGSPEDADAFWIPSKEPYMIHPFLMVRREMIDAVGGYRYVHHAEDTDLYWRLRLKGRLHNLPDVLGDYRLHSESISGGSPQNGRILAVSSQLAGLSARRRAASKADLVFEKRLALRLSSARSLVEMVEIASENLETSEKAYFAMGVGSKIMELAAFRPYELEISDCRFIHRTVNLNNNLLSFGNRRELTRQIAGAAARLAHKRLFQEARILLQPRIYIDFLLRYGLRIAVPTKFRKSLRLGLSGGEPVK